MRSQYAIFYDADQVSVKAAAQKNLICFTLTPLETRMNQIRV